MRMTIDKDTQRLRLGASEWVTFAVVVFGFATGFGTWLWHLSDRVLILEQKLTFQTSILRRLDDDRNAWLTHRLEEGRRSKQGP